MSGGIPYYNFVTTLIRVSLPIFQYIMLKQFMEGCRTGKISLVTACLSASSFDPNKLAHSERSDRPSYTTTSTGFIEACYNGHTEIVTLLLKDSRIDVNSEDINGKTGLMCACEKGQVEIVSVLLQDSRIDVNKGNINGMTGFMYACKNGHREIVTLLSKDSRINVNKTDKYGKTGFIHACRWGNRELVTLLLQDISIDVNQGDVNGWTAFMDACSNERIETVSLLLKEPRINVNKANKYGETGFMISFERREMDIASLITRDSGEMHRRWWEMRVGYLCRQLTSHTFVMNNYELYTLLDLWKRLFTYTTIQEESFFPRNNAIIERSRRIWKREVSEERWREGCDVMRENDTIIALSLFLFPSAHYNWSSYQDTRPYRDLMKAIYPHVRSRDIEEAFNAEEEHDDNNNHNK